MNNPINTIIVKMIPLFPKSFIKLFSMKYVAGITLDEALESCQTLIDDGMSITMDVLGENITHIDEANYAKTKYLEMMDELHKRKIPGNISVKLTQMGLKIDQSACEANVQEIIERARHYNRFVRFDMEESAVTDATLDITEKMHKSYGKVGTVIQAYLKRSKEDIERLTKQGIHIRLCKGIYNESPTIAYKNRREIQDNFIALLDIMFDSKIVSAIATHDPVVVTGALDLISSKNLDKNEYEFQMLLGVAEQLRGKLVDDGHSMRVYVPFGEHWYAYSLRRMKENPQLAGYVLMNLFKR